MVDLARPILRIGTVVSEMKSRIMKHGLKGQEKTKVLNHKEVIL